MAKYIKREDAIQFCKKVLGTDTVYSVEVKNAFKAYKAYLENLATVKTCPCVKCKYATKKITPVGTIRYECMFDHGWRDKEGCCENGREIVLTELNISSIDDARPHKVSEVICVKCGHRWIAVRPEYTKLRELECPNCHLQGYAIETGEEIKE